MNNCMQIKWITWKKIYKFLERYRLSRLNRRGVRGGHNMSRLIKSTEIETMIQNEKKSRTWMKNNIQDLTTLHENFIKHLEKICHLAFWNYSKNCRGKKTSKLIVWAHHHPDTKSTRRYLKKRNSQANITNEHKCKTPQPNTSSPYTTIYLKDHDQVEFIPGCSQGCKGFSTSANPSM